MYNISFKMTQIGLYGIWIQQWSKSIKPSYEPKWVKKSVHLGFTLVGNVCIMEILLNPN